MARVSYRDVADRFTHIDGEVARVSIELRPRDEISKASVVLRFYPWWEHPLYIAARESGGDWGFEWDDDAEREVLVEAIDPLLCSVQPRASAIDIGFSSDDPALWPFEDQGHVFCNSGFDYAAFVAAVGERAEPAKRAALLRYVPPDRGHTAPFSLGYFPRTVYRHFVAALRGLGVALFEEREPVERAPLVAFRIDEHSTIVARDFVLDVPELEHRPEWFRPRGR